MPPRFDDRQFANGLVQRGATFLAQMENKALAASFRRTCLSECGDPTADGDSGQKSRGEQTSCLAQIGDLRRAEVNSPLSRIKQEGPWLSLVSLPWRFSCSGAGPTRHWVRASFSHFEIRLACN